MINFYLPLPQGNWLITHYFHRLIANFIDTAQNCGKKNY
ncbi:hypothetical protein EV05_0108 [Prochlorococcus sp. MIT 0601]|nr:hypothetical protein EV05_0108 [Prochlorococcus sp. MIT 0601]